jgi:Zn-finger nucleic acid-binding protein
MSRFTYFLSPSPRPWVQSPVPQANENKQTNKQTKLDSSRHSQVFFYKRKKKRKFIVETMGSYN